jgi:hypothetical protein
MKIVLNKCFGAYDLPDKYLDKADAKGLSRDDEVMRKDPELIREIEEGTIDNPSCTLLKVVEVPEGFTDYEITDYDGWESIVYVLNGKLYWV